MPRPRVELAEDDEPLDIGGTEVVPSTPGARRVYEVPTASEAQRIIEGSRRRLSDLPVTPKHMNPIACICLYTMYGLDTLEISVATGLPIDQINAIRMSNEYAIMQRAVVDSVMEAETGDVKDYIKKSSRAAARKVSSLVEHPNPDVAMRASKDVLDRAGLRPADVVELRGRMDMGLVIEVVDRRDDTKRPVIDMEDDNGNRT
jgi:hypothetical protein